jgi:ABC transporter substrate binding protein
MSSLKRRRLILLIGVGLAAGVNGWAMAGIGRPSRGAPTIGYLATGSPTDIEGQAIGIEWRFSDARTDPTSSLNAMAADLVALDSDAHPGSNVTGTGANTEVYGKLVELLKEAVPTVTRIGYLRNPNTPGTEQQMVRSQAAAAQLGLALVELQARSYHEIDSATSAAASAGADGMVVSADSAFSPTTGDDNKVTRDSVVYHLPAIYSQMGGYTDDGSLLAYWSQRRAATYVEFAINLKTAQALGLDVPHSVRLQARRVVQ